MGIRKFQIEVLNNPILSYFPGQPIQGHVRFITDTDCKTEGNCEWNERWSLFVSKVFVLGCRN